ncbi:copper chaperone PCu(A)C [Parasphingorhabdus sp. JC815]|uniref:copper chaperone PCu(A)C n=1 Tax=Parasphingorhabdus sp. JC815 TaxID=3232140 RepID=UPI00345A9601
MMKQFSIIFASLAALFLNACGQGDVLLVEEAVVNLSPVEGNPSAGYFTVRGGPEDVSLVGVTADDVLRLEMHETVEEDGVAKMRPVNNVPVPAGGTVKFEPGGKHLMIWGVGSGSIKRGTLRMIFIFSNDDRIQFDAVINKVGGAASEAHGDDHNDEHDEKPATESNKAESDKKVAQPAG